MNFQCNLIDCADGVCRQRCTTACDSLPVAAFSCDTGGITCTCDDSGALLSLGAQIGIGIAVICVILSCIKLAIMLWRRRAAAQDIESQRPILAASARRATAGAKK